QRDVVAAVLLLDARDRAVEHLSAARDDAHRIAEAFGVFHHVRGENHRLTALLEVDDRVLQGLRVDRVAAAQRFVEDHEFGIVEQGADELHFLLHAARKLVDLRLAPVLFGGLERESLHPFIDAAVGLACGESLELPENPEHPAHLHLLVQAALFGQVADPVETAPLGIGPSEDGNAPFVGGDDVEDHPDRRRLSGAVWPEEAVHGALGNSEGKRADGLVIAVALRDRPDVEGRFRHGLPCMECRALRIYDNATTRTKRTDGTIWSFGFPRDRRVSGRRVAVIAGAGPAGLTAAWELLARTDVVPLVFERTRATGGIAQTFEYKGNRIDIGGHRFFSKSERVMRWWFSKLPLQGKPAADESARKLEVEYAREARLQTLSPRGAPGPRMRETTHPAPDPEVEDRVMLQRPRLSRIYFGRNFFPYPIGITVSVAWRLGFVNTALIGLSYIKAQLLPRRDETYLDAFFINRFGRRLYETFFRGYTEKVWGVPCSEIRADWGAQRVKGLSLTRAL